MNVAEARALTDARRDESWSARMLRVKVYPLIESRASEMHDNATIYLQYRAEPKWVKAYWKAVDEVLVTLRKQGYTVEENRHAPAVDSSWLETELEVSW